MKLFLISNVLSGISAILHSKVPIRNLSAFSMFFMLYFYLIRKYRMFEKAINLVDLLMEGTISSASCESSCKRHNVYKGIFG